MNEQDKNKIRDLIAQLEQALEAGRRGPHCWNHASQAAEDAVGLLKELIA